jgi:16S rRNA (guanine966-N2)-methyltransferase
MKTNQIRINAGVWRSRLLKFPDAEGLRPTSDRVRQTLFNWLGQELTGKTCLDLFAGTGALGFEAASRNAKQVTLVEQNALVFKALQHNLSILNGFEMPKSIQLLQSDALSFLAHNTQQFDVIFCDPPYHKAWLDKLLPVLNQHLAQNGVLYVEAEFALKDSENWHIKKSGKAGNVFYHLVEYIA